MKPIEENKLLIGLTGPIGAGKSVVASVWKELGAGVVSGDEMGKRALVVSGVLRRKLVEKFEEEEIVDEFGFVNNRKLAQVAFKTPESVQELTRLTFPVLDKLARIELKKLSLLYNAVVYDAALIYEWEIEQDFDKIVVVTAPRKLLVERAMEHLRITEEEAKARLKSQMTPTEKKKRGDIVIVNDGSLDKLKEQAREVWGKIMA